MSDGGTKNSWFADEASLASESAIQRIRTGSATMPQSWPQQAIEAGLVPDTKAYYAALNEAAVAASKESVTEHGEATDIQIIHQVRTADDLGRVANELAERVIAWGTATSVAFDPTLAGVRALAEESRDDPGSASVSDVARIVAQLIDKQEALHDAIDREMRTVAPNVTAIAGSLLGARLIALAGDLKSLARSTSGTVQVLGAEDALFAHLNDGAPPPKHGIIYTHEYVRGTDHTQRGSAARALAGKLTIAARVDYYSGKRKPEIDRELAERMKTIRERTA